MELIYLYIKKYDNSNKLKKILGINNSNFSIEDKGFNFSDGFNCFFDKEKGLKIEKIDYVGKGFYGKNIKSFKVLAGRNGSGKTTILDIIGMLRDERLDDHFNRSKTDRPKHDIYFSAEYFMIYHMKENKFLIEIAANIMSENECWIKNLDISSIFGNKNMHYKLPIGYVFEYDYGSGTMCATDEHCFNAYEFEKVEEKKIAEIANIYYFSSDFSHRKTKLNSFKSRQDVDDEYMIKRQNLKIGDKEINDYLSIYKLIFSEEYRNFIDKTISTNLMIQITDTYDTEFSLENELYRNKNDKIKIESISKLKNGINEIEEKIYQFNGIIKKSFFEEEIKNKINYNNKEKYLLNLSCRYILNALNALVDISYYDSTNESNKREDEEKNKQEKLDAYEKEINEFKKLIDNIDNIYKDKCEDIYETLLKDISKNKVNENIFEKNLIKNIILSQHLLDRIKSYVTIGKNSSFQDSFEDVLKKLLILDDSYFYNTGLIINPERHEYDNNIINLFKVLDKWYKLESDFPNDVIRKFNIYIPYSSDGEKFVLDVFSKLINIIDKEYRALHIILMDEPDQRLHPEWARQFVYLMIKTIENLFDANYKSQNKELNVQLIISTHSPFILSDIRKEDLILLDNQKNEKGTKQLILRSDTINTFSANIYDILNKSFFLDDTIGEFAKKKIEDNCNKIFKLKKVDFIKKIKCSKITEDNLKNLKYIIEQINEPVMKKLLLKELDKRYYWLKEINYITHTNSEDKVEDIIEGYLKLSNKDKRKFIKRLIESEEGKSHD